MLKRLMNLFREADQEATKSKVPRLSISLFLFWQNVFAYEMAIFHAEALAVCHSIFLQHTVFLRIVSAETILF